MTGAARAEDQDDNAVRVWGMSGGLVLMLHASLIATAISWQASHPLSLPPAAPMMIDLAPLPTPEAPPKPVTPPPPPKPVERKVVEPVKRPPPLVRKAEVALPKPVEAPRPLPRRLRRPNRHNPPSLPRHNPLRPNPRRRQSTLAARGKAHCWRIWNATNAIPAPPRPDDRKGSSPSASR
ncbi:hypothetical protein [Magnetospirillum fulvum]|uniref:hypothetical protein n=1 Tax=Magnetospirillum fulvum TaxID=1082 RepID=UPI000422896C|nr:hypothetical protein [Magnetospirillum fulvum]